jgi:threonine dehydratase
MLDTSAHLLYCYTKASLLFGKFDAAGRHVGVIVSGGNVDLAPFFDTMKGAL